LNKTNKDVIIVFSIALIIFATSFFSVSSQTEQIIISESEFGEPTPYFNLILIGGAIIILVLWYYFKKVKEIEGEDFSGQKKVSSN